MELTTSDLVGRRGRRGVENGGIESREGERVFRMEWDHHRSPDLDSCGSEIRSIGGGEIRQISICRCRSTIRSRSERWTRWRGMVEDRTRISVGMESIHRSWLERWTWRWGGMCQEWVIFIVWSGYRSRFECGTGWQS